MKKFSFALILLASSLFATSIPLNQGWNLVGAVNNIDPQSIGCAKTIWTYRNGGWSLYVRDNSDQNNYGFPQINTINAGEGFWVNADSSCNIDFSGSADVSPTVGSEYYAYGLYLRDRKSDEVYTVSNSLGTNSVIFDANTSTFTLSAFRDDNRDSRAGLVLYDSNITSVQATVNLHTDGTTWENIAQLNVGRMAISGNSDTLGEAGIVIAQDGIATWYTLDNSDGTWTEVYGDNLATSGNYKDRDLNVRITVDGTKIVYEVTDATDGSLIGTKTYDTDTNASSTIASSIGKVEVRARVKDNADLNAQAAPSSIVTLKDMKIIKAIPFVVSSFSNAIDISTLNNFIIMWPDDDNPNYMSFVRKNDGSLDGKSYEFDNNQWVNDENISIVANGDTVTLPDGKQIKFSVYDTRKVTSMGGVAYDDLYISNVYEEVLVEGSTWDYDVWEDWDNPSYYDPNTNKQVDITDFSSLVAGFTTPSGNNGGGNNIDGIFLNADHTVVAGQKDGVNSEGYQMYKRTDTVIGSWTTDGDKIIVDTPKMKYSIELTSDNHIKVGEHEKVGHISKDVFMTGNDATDANVRAFLTTD